MTTGTMPFLEMDAGEQREFLAEELAAWTEAGFWSTSRAKTFHGRANILARSIGMPRAELLDVLRGDADAILESRTSAPQDAPTSAS